MLRSHHHAFKQLGRLLLEEKFKTLPRISRMHTDFHGFQISQIRVIRGG